MTEIPKTTISGDVSDSSDSTGFNRAAEHINLMALLWQRMREIYGQKLWNDRYSKNARDTWAAGLARLTREMVVEGAKRCQDEATFALPPTLPEFRELCIRGRRRQCRDQLLRVLNYAAVENWFSDPAAYAVYRLHSHHDWRQMDIRSFAAAFEEAFVGIDFNRLPELPRASSSPKLEHVTQSAEGQASGLAAMRDGMDHPPSRKEAAAALQKIQDEANRRGAV